MKRVLLLLITALLLGAGIADAKSTRTRKKRSSTTTTSTQAPAKKKQEAPRTSSTVQKEKKENEQRMNQARQELKDNQKRTSRQINALNSLNGEIRQQTADIAQLNQTIAGLDSLAAALTDSITTIGKDIETLRANCAKSLRDARTARQKLSVLSLLFSSESFYQAMRRLEYIRQLERWRASKTEQLRASIELLNQKKERLAQTKREHAVAVNNLNTQKRELQSKRERTEQMVASLRKEGKNLEAELKQRQQRARSLDAELNRIIAEEMRKAEQERLAAERAAAEAAAKAAAEAKRKAEQEQAKAKTNDGKNKPADKPQDLTKQPPEQQVANTPQQRELKEKAAANRDLTGSFANNKGRLLFPVAGRYNVVGMFGRSRHSSLSQVEIDNSGVDIEVQPGQNARAVFGGTVSAIFHMDGYHNIIMVRHGEYITIYANIDRPAVKKGDTVKAGQNLGHIYSDPDDDNRTTLHFEVRNEREKLNPLEWVK